MGMQGWRVGWILLVVGLMLGARHVARAQDAYPGGYTLMPIQPDKIVLLSMTVDVSFHDDGEQTIAEVQANYRLHNRHKSQAQTLTVAVPGYPAPKPAPKTISLQLNGKELPLKPGNQQWWLAEVTLKPNQRANVVMTYAATVGQGPLAHFRYPMDLTGQMWPGRLESARFTIAFTEPPNPQSWIRLTPENYQLSAEAVTWSYDLKDPQEPIDFLFIRPSLWQQIQEARRQAAAQQSPQAYKDLGQMYTQLATALPDPDIFERYYPLAVASYAQAQQLNPDDVDTYLALAQLYQWRADRVPEEGAAYMSLAIKELTKALSHGVQDPAIEQRVVEGILDLAARARERGDFDAANTYLGQLEDVLAARPDSTAAQALQQERRALALAWARHVLDEQGPAPARAVLAQTLGPEGIQPPNTRFAQVNSLYVWVHTEPHQRIIDVSAAVRDQGLDLLDQLAGILASTGAAELEMQETDPAILRVVIPFENAQDLLQRQERLAQAIPQQAEWAMLQAILAPESLVWETTDERWRTVERYEEHISLITASADPGLQALALERAAHALDTTDPLNALLQDIWLQEAQVWTNLAENSHARFTLTLYPRPGAPLEQTWSARAGEEVVMTGQAVQYHLGMILAVALVVYLFFVLLTWFLFRHTL